MILTRSIDNHFNIGSDIWDVLWILSNYKFI